MEDNLEAGWLISLANNNNDNNNNNNNNNNNYLEAGWLISLVNEGSLIWIRWERGIRCHSGSGFRMEENKLSYSQFAREAFLPAPGFNHNGH